MTPLDVQLYSELGLGAAALYAILFLAPFVALWRAQRRVRWIAVGLALAAVLARLPALESTPEGVHPDDTQSLLELSLQPRWQTRHMFGELTVSGGTGWCELPWYVAYRLTGSLLAIRVLGMAWSGVLTLYVVLFGARLFGPAGGALAGAAIAFIPWSMWLSRHPWGPEIMLQQCYLFAAVEAFRRRPTWGRVLVAGLIGGLMVALLQVTYLGARIAAVFPLALIAVGPWPPLGRALAFLIVTYAAAVAGVLPHVFTNPNDFWFSGHMVGFDPKLADWGFAVTKLGLVLGSLVSSSYGIFGTASFPGGQTLPPLVLALVFVGAVKNFLGVGRPLLVAACLGVVPCWISVAPGGNTHRLMMMLLPMALLAGGAAALAPARHRGRVAALLVAAVAFVCLRMWFSDDYWRPIRGQWTLALHSLIGEELERRSGEKLRVHPNEPAVGLAALERGFGRYDLVFGPSDFAGSEPTTVIWTGANDAWLSPFVEAERNGSAKVERMPPSLGITRLPHGFRGMLGDPPRHGWSYTVVCGEGESRQESRFVTPLLFEHLGFPIFESSAPCRFRWRARAARPIENAALWGSVNAPGEIRIGGRSTPATPPVTKLPHIGAGERIEVELDAGQRRIEADFRESFGTALSWYAVAPEDGRP